MIFISYKAAIKALDDGILVCKKNPMSGAELYVYKSIIMQKGTEAVFTKKMGAGHVCNLYCIIQCKFMSCSRVSPTKAIARLNWMMRQGMQSGTLGALSWQSIRN